MKQIGLGLAFTIWVASGADAQECTSHQEFARADLVTAFRSLSSTLRKARARLASQDIRMGELPEAVIATIPDKPDAPNVPSYFDEDGNVTFACDASHDANIVAARDSLNSFGDTVEAYALSASTRSDALDAAITALESGEISDEGEAVTDTADDDSGESADADDVVGRKPMADTDNPNISRRVITGPSAILRDNVGDADGEPLAPLSILYVFDETLQSDVLWIEVGASTREGSQGWLPVAETFEWSTMLVMGFAPTGKRKQVLFFEDETDLADLVADPLVEQEAKAIYDGVIAERERAKEDPAYSPNWNPKLVAIEPETGVTFDNQPYLLPILDWRDDVDFDTGDETVLLRIAAVPADAEEIGERDDNSFTIDASDRAGEDGEFRIGVVFVLDTTVSMRPFIQRTYQTVEYFYDAFERFENPAYVSFGLIGFRDNIDINPDGLEYVTREFQPLDVAAVSNEVLANMRQIDAANVPTQGFEEDGLAGLMEALDQDWSPFDLRLVVYVTDASARSGADPLAAIPDLTAESMLALARQDNVVILPVHLITPDNQRYRNVEIARIQYEILADTGDFNTLKYVQVNAESDEEFADVMLTTADRIVQEVLTVNAGDVANREPKPRASGGSAAATTLADAVANEIFRAQLESLATVGNGDAPRFLSGWASDRDLTDSELESLTVSVFLTRNQLSTLGRRLNRIVDAFRLAEDDPNAFFTRLQALAAETATDPDAITGDEVMEALMPSFLRNLPYKSQILRLDREYWNSLSVSDRQKFIEDLEAKQRIYADTAANSAIWRDFGSNDPGLSATPVDLNLLP